MNEQGKTLTSILSSLAPTGKEAEETLHAIVLGDADAIVIETREGPRVYTLRDAGEPYRELVERMSDAAAILNSEHTILYCNGGLARMLGRQGLAGANFLDVVTPDQRQRAKNLLAAGACGRFNAEVALMTAAGGMTRAQASAAPMSFDGQPCVAVVVTALDEMRESQQRIQLATEATGVGIWEMIHQVEGNLIMPLIQRRMINVPPALMLLGIASMGALTGLSGLVFAAPLVVVACVVAQKTYMREALKEPVVLPGGSANQEVSKHGGQDKR